jgi:hypothetical protein
VGSGLISYGKKTSVIRNNNTWKCGECIMLVLHVRQGSGQGIVTYME